jgi:4-methylaminobutanoate oxidase (formaldehyde-forming)
VDSDLGWLRLHRREEDGPLALRDASEEHAVIGMWGPAARDVLAAVTDDDVSAAAFPFRTARRLTVAGAPVEAQRITYVGELGFELYVPPRWAVQVWDRLRAAGGEHGIRAAGYRTLDGLRMEKGYRYMGTDLTAGDTPFEAGLGFAVALEKGDFVGREALAAAAEAPPTRRIRTLVVGCGAPLTVYGGEAVHAGDGVVGRVRSAAYGFTVGRMLATAYLPSELGDGARLAVDALGDRVAAEVAADVLYDPEHARVRA